MRTASPLGQLYWSTASPPSRRKFCIHGIRVALSGYAAGVLERRRRAAAAAAAGVERLLEADVFVPGVPGPESPPSGGPFGLAT